MPDSYLFISSGDKTEIGGHTYSGIALASALMKQGNKVGLLMAPIQSNVPDFFNITPNFHPSPYPKNRHLAFIRRSIDIFRTVRKERYDVLVATDHQGALHAFLCVIITGVPLIQVHCGGIVRFPPLRLPNVIVFTEELYYGYQQRFKFPLEYMRISSGRVDFNYFKITGENIPNLLDFSSKGVQILAISRLVSQKISSLEYLLDKIKLIGNQEIVHLRVVGDGNGKKRIEQYAEKIRPYIHPKSSIQFLGAFRVTPDILSQADLVIGQGRTVIEAIASGTPAAVSGALGYHGLITINNFLPLYKTNFTGRELSSGSSLQDDINYLRNYKSSGEYQAVYELAKSKFDVDLGAGEIEALSKHFFSLYPGSTQRRFAYLRAYFAYVLFSLGYSYKRVVRRLFLRRRIVSSQ